MLPSISVVVTCYNYGHFLAACLDSLQLQARPPDQIIVVDDGSADSTQAVLGARQEPLVVITKGNGGQASAFNAGFERATGDIVVFLDADDTLAPDAVEILCMAWHDSFVALSFKLNLIDGRGRLSGYYDVDPRDGDMRPELIGWGHFWFMPTSGNAFSRRRIAPMFPLPEPRWRISADAVLMFAVALANPIRQIPLALGNYRAHGGNAYYRAVLPQPQFMTRALRDMADSCLAAANLNPNEHIFGPETDIVRLELLIASLRQSLSLGQWSGNPGTVRSLQASIRRLDIGFRARWVAGFCLAVVPLAVRLVPRLPHWIIAPDERPRLLHTLVTRAFGSRTMGYRRSAHRSRWLDSVPKGHVSLRDGKGYAPYFNTLDWRMRRPDRGPVLCGKSGEITIPIDYFPNGATLTFTLKALEPYARMLMEVALFKAGQVLGRVRIVGKGRLSVALEPKVTLLESRLQLTLSASPMPATLAQRWAVLGAQAGSVEVTGLDVEALPPERTGLFLGLGEQHGFAEIADACQISPPVDQEHPDIVEAGGLVIALVRPNIPELTELVLRFQEGQPNGLLVVADARGPLFRGYVGPMAMVRVPISSYRRPSEGGLTLTLNLDPDDPFAAPEFRLSTIGLVGRGSRFDDRSPEAFPLIGTGAIWRFDEEGLELPGFFGDGWMPGEHGAQLFDTFGILRLTIDHAASSDSVLHLSVAPALPLPDDALLAVAITAGEEVLSQVLLQGEYDLAIPLRGALSKTGRKLELAVHVALSDVKVAEGQLDRGGLLLKSARLSASAEPLPAWRAPFPQGGRTLGSEIQEAAHAARSMRGNEGGLTADEVSSLPARRDRIASTISSLAGGAVLPVLLDGETLDCLCDIGEAAGAPEGISVSQQSRLDDTGLCSSHPAEAVRSVALAMLAVAPWRALSVRGFGELPDVLLAFPRQLARYLCSAAHLIASPGDDIAYGVHARALLVHARDLLANEPRGSRQERFAEEILHQMQFHPSFARNELMGDIARAFGAAIETHQLMRGRRLTLVARPAKPTGRRRLGILLRDLAAGQEMRLVAATLRALPRDNADVIVFSLEGKTGATVKFRPAATLVDLQGLDADRSVEVIRAAQLDALLFCASLDRYDEAVAIAAHRLAQLQVAVGALAPLAAGLKSFDAVAKLAAATGRQGAEVADHPSPPCRIEPHEEKALGRYLAEVLTRTPDA